MKKKLIFIGAGILIVCTCFFIYSCSKKLDATPAGSPVPGNLLLAAQSWHAAHTHATGTLDSSSGKKAYVLPPTWKEARLQQQSDGSSAIVVPSPDAGIDPGSTRGMARKFVFTAQGDKITGGRIIEMFSSKDSIANRNSTLVENYANGDVDNFTGSAISYDVNYNRISSEVYVNGIKVKNRQAKVMSMSVASFNKKFGTTGKNSLGSPITTLDDSGCMYLIYQEWYDYGTADQYLISTTILDEWGCDGEGGNNNEAGGGGGGSGSGTGSSSPAVATITDKLVNQCLISTYVAMGSTYAGNMGDELNSILQSVFNVSDKVNLTYNESSTLASTRMAQTIPSVLGTDANGNTVFNVDIYLNSNVLPFASQELTAVTMLHEALHGYFEYNQTNAGNALEQHLDMAQNYIDKIRVFVQLNFPNLSDKDANILILSEMADIYTADPQKFASLLSQNNITVNDYNTILPTYKNPNGTAGNTGTRCP